MTIAVDLGRKAKKKKQNKISCLICYFCKICNRRLLEIIGGALRVKCCLFCFADEEELDSEIKLDEKIFCNMIGPCGCELIHR